MILKNCNERMAPHRIAQVKRIPWCKRLCNVHATLAKNFTVIESLVYQKTFSGLSTNAILFGSYNFQPWPCMVQPRKMLCFEKLTDHFLWVSVILKGKVNEGRQWPLRESLSNHGNEKQWPHLWISFSIRLLILATSAKKSRLRPSHVSNQPISQQRQHWALRSKVIIL